MKKIGVYIALIAFAATASAQTRLQAQKSAKTNSEAKDLLEVVSSKVESYDNIVIAFEYTLRDPDANMNRETRGTISLKGEKYMLDLMGVKRLFDGKKIYTIAPEDEEITISTYDPENDSAFTPSKMLVFYKNGYRSQMDITQNVQGRTIQYVKLSPTAKDSEVKQILLGLDKQTKHIYTMIQKMKDGSQITIKINSFKTNQPLSESLFTFKEDKYEGYYINRLD